MGKVIPACLENKNPLSWACFDYSSLRMKDLIEYLERHGIEYTIDRNPSPEKIERLKKKIEEKEKLKRLFSINK